ncbi:MAG: hypothetical protein ABIH41_04520, partial [Nanoarchaeota archaeon]
DVGPIKIKDKVITNVKQRVTSVRDLAPGVSKEQVLACLKDAFFSGKRWSEAPISQEESSLAERLAKDRYGSAQWLLSR